jgi:hypothetical protein
LGSSTLIADLGCFTIGTNAAAAQAWSAEEAALYEAFAVRVDHVSAYLLDGPFAWPSKEELLAAAKQHQQPAPSSSGSSGSGTTLAVGGASSAAAAGESVLQRLLAQRARVVPLLYPFGLGMDLQVATSVHPK